MIYAYNKYQYGPWGPTYMCGAQKTGLGPTHVYVGLGPVHVRPVLHVYIIKQV